MEKVPSWIYSKWQEIADLLAKLIKVPAALIMYTENEYMEVSVSSKNTENPYNVGDREKWDGLFCETVIKTQKKLLIPNALKDKKWENNPDIKLGMISYLGFPINFPDHTPFGTICILDNKENAYNNEFKQLLFHFKKIIENDLIHIFEFKNKEELLNAQLIEQNRELQRIIGKAKDNERRLNEAQHLAKIGNWELDLIQNKLYWSDEIYQIFHCTPQEFEATYEAFLSYVHPDDRDFVNDAYSKHIKSKEPYNIIHRILLPGNKIKYVNERCSSVFDDHGNAMFSKGTVADISERIEYEHKLLKAKEKAEESNRLKTEFLHNLSHEIRTPMNGIIGFSGMLDKPDLDLAKRKQYTKLIQKSSNQLLRIIEDLLEMSNLETSQVDLNKDSFSLNELIMELFAQFNSQAIEKYIPIKIKLGLPDWQSKIISDKYKLKKILTNLLENAIKYTNEGYIEIGYYLVDNYLKVYIEDTGIGISHQKKDVIFERFTQEEEGFSKDKGGLGLGLPISQKYAKLLGGNISYVSEKGRGSTFTVSIPYFAAETFDEIVKNIKKETTNKKIKKDQINILIAEDEEVNYLFLEALLEEFTELNIKILHAMNGQEAVEISQSNIDIDIAFMDIKMPIMNGHEAAKKIKAFRPDLPIIAQTAYAAELDRIKALENGCDDFISKPVEREKLFEMIHRHLRKAQLSKN